jgi:glyceraldehyde 3-phosphate dehydrogenase
VVAINDLGPVETNAHLLRYDSVHGRFPGTVTTMETPSTWAAARSR